MPKGRRQTLLNSGLKLLDKNTIQMRSNQNSSNSQQLKFNAVGFEYDGHVGHELNELLEQLFDKQRNCSLLRLTTRRVHNVKLLTRLLVSDVDKMLQKLTYRIVGISLKYYDIRKFDMVNMLSTLCRYGKHDESGCRKMQNTLELFQWLHNEYSTLSARITGDEYMHVEFTLVDATNKMHLVQLTVFNIFDCNARTDVDDFFRAVSSGGKVKSTPLTDCIRECFKGLICTLVFCEISVDKESSSSIHKFLKLAHAAQPQKVESMEAPSSQSMGAKTKAKETLPHLSQQDNNRLLGWQQRIQSLFDKVKLHMEQFYQVQYQQQFMKLCRNLKYTPSSGGDAGRTMLMSGIQIDGTKAKYIEMLLEFRQLEKRVKQTPFGTTLSKQINTKILELVNAEKHLQRRQAKGLKDQRQNILNEL